MQGPVLAEVNKDLYYWEIPHYAMHNTLDTMVAIATKGYPKQWWGPLLWDRVSKWGGPLEPLRASMSPGMLSTP